MTNTRIILLAICLAILLAMLVLWCADTLAHIPTWESAYPGDPNPFGVVSHFCPNTTTDPCWGDEFCADGSKQYQGGHGHIYADGGWGYWKAEQRGTWDDGSSPDCSGTSTVKPNPNPRRPNTQTPQSPGGSPQSLIPSERTHTIGARPSAAVEEIELDADCEDGWLQHFIWEETILGLSVIPAGVETIRDLWEAWGFSKEAGHSISILLPMGNVVTYDDPDSAVQNYGCGTDAWHIGCMPLYPHMGLIITQKKRDILNANGCQLENADGIWLNAGVNLIGFPEKPDGFNVPSDFLSDKVISVTVQVGGVYGATYEEITEAGDTGDATIRAGDAIIMTATEGHWVSLSAPSAPSAQRHGTLTTSWGRVKRDTFSR